MTQSDGRVLDQAEERARVAFYIRRVISSTWQRFRALVLWGCEGCKDTCRADDEIGGYDVFQSCGMWRVRIRTLGSSSGATGLHSRFGGQDQRSSYMNSWIQAARPKIELGFGDSIQEVMLQGSC